MSSFGFQSTEEEWQKVFFVGAVLLIGSALVFAMCGSGYVQEWNNIRGEPVPDADLNAIEHQAILITDQALKHTSVALEEYNHTEKA